MTKKNSLPEEVFGHTTDLRRELEGKIDKKIDGQVFYWIMFLFFLVSSAVIGYAYHLIAITNDNAALLRDRVLIIETHTSIKN